VRNFIETRLEPANAKISDFIFYENNDCFIIDAIECLVKIHNNIVNSEIDLNDNDTENNIENQNEDENKEDLGKVKLPPKLTKNVLKVTKNDIIKYSTERITEIASDFVQLGSEFNEDNNILIDFEKIEYKLISEIRKKPEIIFSGLGYIQLSEDTKTNTVQLKTTNTTSNIRAVELTDEMLLNLKTIEKIDLKDVV